jgi:hypothetical protein
MRGSFITECCDSPSMACSRSRSLGYLHVLSDLTWKVIKVADCYHRHKGTALS